MPDALQLEQLLIRQGSFTLAADLAVQSGSVTAIMGPSGGGKSTLLGAVAGFVPLERGRVFWYGDDITQSPPGQRPLSILFQDNNLFPHLTIAQNIGLGRSPRLKLGTPEWSEIDTILERLGLAGMGKRKPSELSGGQQSRAALGRVLMARRPLVLLDEPFAALGPGLKQEMLDLAISSLSEAGQTLVMVTHDPDDARRVAGNVIVVAEGKAHAPLPTGQALDGATGPLRGYLAQP
ncbi:thiamine ABC transporter ATP-binding protein [Flavimaricola marinus]|uniref:Thiamine import ATP-binding protein ThiQ n=1 Tax=Flavimaricola marinus TaxID=1819565 RepID=A0A238LIL1_9RHOB|nr:ATP-binding cassette domain-containing protein [Flavimaricola marinus]SMY09383.1 Thiamine import ATP-binding protein ThiQ [Flavimaricola marinus]